MKKKRSANLKRIGLTLAGLGALVSGSAMAAGGLQVQSDGGLKVCDPTCGDFWFSLGGRLNFDETLFAGGFQDKRGDFPSGANIRRALLGFEGGVGPYLSYNLTLDFAGGFGAEHLNRTTVDFDDAWIQACSEYEGPINRAAVRFGQFTPPVSIDAWGDTGLENDTMFLEPALATTAFTIPTKVLGVWFDSTAMDMFALSAAVYHPRQNNTTHANNENSHNNYQNANRSDRMGGSVRLTFVPVHTCDTVYHLGVIGRYQAVNHKNADGPAFQDNLFATGPEARARNTNRLVTTGGITDGTALPVGLANSIRARSYNVVTGEALALWGPLTVEGEYYSANVQRVPTITDARTRGNPRFNGWHAEAAYVLTGESRVYDFVRGTLGNPKPCSKAGAWEIAARFSFINLVDRTRNVNGGSEHNMTFGLNWFVNDNIRIAANYIRANIRATTIPTTGIIVPVPAPTSPKRQLDIFGLRFGVVF